MAMQPFVLQSLLVITAVEASLYSHALSKCVRRCEHENSCHSSLESFSCEATCKSMCECAERSRRMLNKPRNCQPAMLEEQKKQLSLIRSKARMSKVQLRETQKQPDLFDGYIALEDFWPKAASAPDAKPRMLNGDHSLSLLKKHAAQPWSAAAHPYAHRHHSLAQMKTAPQHPSNASLASNASKAKTSNASLASNASKVQVASQKKCYSHSEEAG